METSLILFVLIGSIAGWLAGQIMKGVGFGVLGDIVVGVIGSVIGGFLFQRSGVFAGSGFLGMSVHRDHRRYNPAVCVASGQKSVRHMLFEAARGDVYARVLDGPSL